MMYILMTRWYNDTSIQRPDAKVKRGSNMALCIDTTRVQGKVPSLEPSRSSLVDNDLMCSGSKPFMRWPALLMAFQSPLPPHSCPCSRSCLGSYSWWLSNAYAHDARISVSSSVQLELVMLNLVLAASWRQHQSPITDLSWDIIGGKEEGGKEEGGCLLVLIYQDLLRDLPTMHMLSINSQIPPVFPSISRFEWGKGHTQRSLEDI